MKLISRYLDAVLFLDFDGVLNHAGWSLTEGPFDPACCARLARVLDATEARVCLSTAWRAAHSMRELCALLQQHGLGDRVVGITPVGAGCVRGAEIAAWLSIHDVQRFAIVDDDKGAACGPEWDVDPNLWGRFVHTSFDEGLTDAQADRLIALLSAEGAP